MTEWEVSVVGGERFRAVLDTDTDIGIGIDTRDTISTNGITSRYLIPGSTYIEAFGQRRHTKQGDARGNGKTRYSIRGTRYDISKYRKFDISILRIFK